MSEIKARFVASSMPGKEGVWLEVPLDDLRRVSALMPDLCERIERPTNMPLEIESHISATHAYLEPEHAMPTFLAMTRDAGFTVRMDWRSMTPSPDWSAASFMTFQASLVDPEGYQAVLEIEEILIGLQAELADGVQGEISAVDKTASGESALVVRTDDGRRYAVPVGECNRYLRLLPAPETGCEPGF